MTDIAIDALPDGQQFKNGDVLPIVRAGVTVQVVRQQAGVAAVFENNLTATVIAVAGTFVEVAGVLALVTGVDYTVSGGAKFTYTGTVDQQNSLIWWTFSAEAGGGGVEESYAFKLHLNGSPVPGRCTIKPDVGDLDAGSLIAVIGTITNGDEITLEVANLDGTKDITIMDQSIAILSD